MADDAAEAARTPIANFDALAQYAQELAKQPYVESPPLPKALAELSYDEYRQISFRVNKGIGRQAGKPYWLELFHRGYVHTDQVKINVIDEAGVTRPVLFAPKLFHYEGELKAGAIPDDLGFAGLRIAGAFPGQRDPQEIVTFLGSSYFRARAAKHVYGSSARGLAVNIGLPQTEEFPVFREFWFESRDNESEPIHILALLDSPSVAGAYDFTIHPGGAETAVEVRARLFFRTVPEKIGLAPLTSMWLWGDGLKRAKGDHRPEVHDSDGLLMHSADGSWTWRALSQQHYPSIVRFPMKGILGFGLMQRDQQFLHYRDKEAMYDKRPSLWVEPTAEWQGGAIELLELPAPHEGIDNIAAWWVPGEPVQPGVPLDVSYRIRFMSDEPRQHTLAKAEAFRLNRLSSDRFELEIDFAGADLAKAHSEEPPTVSVTSVRGNVPKAVCEKQLNGSWTARLELQPTGEGPVELTATLMRCGQAASETFCYLCPLQPPPVSLPPWRLKQNGTSEEAMP